MPADTFSNTLGYLIMGTGNDNNSWGNNANTEVFQIFEDALANVLTSTVTGGTLDFSGSAPPAAASQVRYHTLVFNGVLGSSQIIIVPNLTKAWSVRNNTTGAFVLQIQTPTGALSTPIPQNGGAQNVYCDGNNNITVSPFNAGQIEMPDGSLTAPSYSWINEVNSGWRRAGTQDYRYTINGVDVMQITGPSAGTPNIVNVLAPNALQVHGGNVLFNNTTFLAVDGTVGAPGFTFNNEQTTGLYRIGAGDVGFAVLGVKQLEITSVSFSWLGATFAGTDLSPASFSTSQNNYTPTNLNTATCLRLNVTGLCSLTGLAGGAAGREIELQNVGTATLQVPANSGASLPANRFSQTFNLIPGGTVALRYDSTQGLWVPKNIVTAFAQCAIAAVSPDLLIVNHTGTENTKIDVSAGEAVLIDSSGNAIKFESIAFTIDSTTTGPNGCDTGTRAANARYFAYMVSDGVLIKGAISTSSVAATMLSNLQANGGANYVYAKRIGAQFTDGSSNFLRIRQVGRRAGYVVTPATNTATVPSIGIIPNGANTALPLAGFMPTTAVIAYISFITLSSRAWAAPNANYVDCSGGATPAAPVQVNPGSANMNMIGSILLESQNIWVNSTGNNNQLTAIGWEDAI